MAKKRTKMTDFHVEFVFAGKWTNERIIEADDLLYEEYDDYTASMGNGDSTHSVSLWVTATTADEALEKARVVVSEFNTEVPIGFEVTDDARFDALASVPNYPEIVSAVEAAEMLGVSRQRVHQLYADNDQFPTALYHLKTGPLWVKGSIEHFARVWERKPGRPKKTA